MKRIRYILLFVLAIILIALSSCTTNDSSFTTRTMTAATTQTFTQTFTPTSSTRTMTAATTQTFVPTSTKMPTPFSTLSFEQWDQQNRLISTLLNTNYNECNFPCLIGITPGKTRWDEAKRILSKAGLYIIESDLPQQVSSWTWHGIGGTSFYTEGVLSTDFGFYVHGDVVDHIFIKSEGGLGKPIPAFRTMWAGFAPEKLIPEMGIPSRIEIYSAFSPGEGPASGAFHDLDIFYDNLGLLIEYRVIDNLESVYKICPTFSEVGNTVDLLRIILKSLDDNTPIEHYDTAYQPNLVMNVEKAAGITPEDFFNLYMQTGKPVCFNVLPIVFQQH